VAIKTRANTWKNWAGNQECSPARIERPTSESELVALVKRAAADDLRVKVVGAGHSFTDIAMTDGVLVDLSAYGRVLSSDTAAGTVTVEAGIPLLALNDAVAERGLALENLGDIAYQSIAGATATATHGTGAQFRNISSRIIGMRIITGDGSIVECSASGSGAEENPEVLRVARVGVGALGIVSTVTLQCVPAFNLHAIEEPMRVDELLADLDAHVDGNDHFEFFWVPHTGWALTKRNRRTTEPAQPRGRWHSFRDDYLLSNVAFGTMCRLGRRRPALIPRLAKIIPSTGRVEYIDRSDRVFASPRLVHFYEMEYAVPREALPEALNRVRALVDRMGVNISFPVEVRFVQGDDIPLSTASGRDTGYIAVHAYRGTPYDQYFQGVERIMNDYEGRPHWGKMHFQRAETLAPRYPEWDAFQAVRNQLDPDRRFSNLYLERVLGP
jgi:L-gulonolactone oxidase